MTTETTIDTRRLYFTTPGLADINALVMLGVNVKSSTTAIGQFGTGLKYAIAGVLRLGGTIRIWIGGKEYHFTPSPISIRGQEFVSIRMCWFDGDWDREGSSQRLGFTTDFGEHWENWEILRELLANTHDERGVVGTEEPAGNDNSTVIEVDCPALLVEFDRRGEFWLESQALGEWGGVEIHRIDENTRAKAIYYQGIQALSTPLASWRWAYSIVAPMSLTENRTFADQWGVRRMIAKALLSCDNEEVLERVFEGGEEGLGLDFDWPDHPPSDTFVRLGLKRLLAGKGNFPASARAAIKRHRGKEVEEAEAPKAEGKSWEELEAGAPNVERAGSCYEATSIIYNMDSKIEQLEKARDYWKELARQLMGDGAAQEANEKIETLRQAGELREEEPGSAPSPESAAIAALLEPPHAL